jgi:hypothetical protein
MVVVSRRAIVLSRCRSSARLLCWPAVAVLAALAGGVGVPALAAPALPEIRLSPRNAVPACVTPERLMAFLRQRNGRLDPRFRNIAAFYKKHGETWGVRWDYAFFQMAIETNFLTYRRPNGRMGDVDPRQNNFAGIGTTGGGVPGDSFPDVSTGVLGQIQHLVVYSGEMVPNPVAPRTQLKQEHILAISRALNRPVRFSDLARRWAVDPKYANSIEWVAERFRAEYCRSRGAPPETEVLPWQQKPLRGADAGRAVMPAKASAPQDRAAKSALRAPVPPVAAVEAPAAPASSAAAPPADAVRTDPADAEESEARFALFKPPAGLASATPPAAEAPAVPAEAPMAVAGSSVGGFLMADKPAFRPPSGLGVKPGRCVVETARYGGETTVLVKSPQGADVHFIALSVLDGFEDSMTKSFLDSRPEGGEVLGTFPSRDAALVQARRLCPA